MNYFFINIIGRLDNIEEQRETVKKSRFAIIVNEFKSMKEIFETNINMNKGGSDELHDELFNIDCRVIQTEQ